MPWFSSFRGYKSSVEGNYSRREVITKEIGALFQLGDFLVLCVFATGATMFGQNEFLRGVGFVSFRDVVEVTALGAL